MVAFQDCSVHFGIYASLLLLLLYILNSLLYPNQDSMVPVVSYTKYYVTDFVIIQIHLFYGGLLFWTN
jgi:hypothetical protein